MIGMIAFLIGVIGYMIQGYLASITQRFEKLDDKLTKHMDKVEAALNEEKENYFNLSIGLNLSAKWFEKRKID